MVVRRRPASDLRHLAQDQACTMYRIDVPFQLAQTKPSNRSLDDTAPYDDDLLDSPNYSIRGGHKEVFADDFLNQERLAALDWPTWTTSSNSFSPLSLYYCLWALKEATFKHEAVAHIACVTLKDEDAATPLASLPAPLIQVPGL